ncbi:hypothetical protein ADEAN_000143900 [Angomonas deanei]|uniref:Uncharacterized protein n=1 Tax=Angomonas deanei TaxID=59799 RepID=A0A7G2C3B1_9TRYP|nr:hypothetical protein ADEAN_000143900 [Angomonas deanei]
MTREGGSLRVTPTSIVQVPRALRHAERKRTPLFQESGSSSDTPHTVTHENSDASTAFDKQSTVQYVRTSEKNGFESDNSPFKREATERCAAEFPWDGCYSPDDPQLRLNVLTPLERPMEQHASGDLGKLNALSSFDGRFNFFKPIVMSSGKKPNEAPSEERDVSGTLPRNLTQSMTNTFVSPAGANNAADDDPLSPLSPHRCSTSVFSVERYEHMKRNTLTPTAAVRHPLSGFSLVSQAKTVGGAGWTAREVDFSSRGGGRGRD